MRKSCLVAMVICCVGGQALAADPKGDWLVADGTTVVRIGVCGDALCGIIALAKDPKGTWTKDPGGTDSQNPDPAKRSRPIAGLPLLLGMKPTGPDRWDGEVYNPQNGQTYTAHIALKGPDVLRIEGCVLGVLCGGEDWTRTSGENPPRPSGAAQTPPAARTK